MADDDPFLRMQWDGSTLPKELAAITPGQYLLMPVAPQLDVPVDVGEIAFDDTWQYWDEGVARETRVLVGKPVEIVPGLWRCPVQVVAHGAPVGHQGSTALQAMLVAMRELQYFFLSRQASPAGQP